MKTLELMLEAPAPDPPIASRGKADEDERSGWIEPGDVWTSPRWILVAGAGNNAEWAD